MAKSLKNQSQEESLDGAISSRAQFVVDNLDSPFNLALTLANLPPLAIPAGKVTKASLRRRLLHAAPKIFAGPLTGPRQYRKDSRNRLVVIEGAKS